MHDLELNRRMIAPTEPIASAVAAFAVDETDRDRLTDQRDRAKAAYDRAMRQWRDGA